MTETHLTIEPGMLDVRTPGPVIAGIWLATDDSEFPMAGWSDFAVVVLGWWSEAILRLLRNEGETVRVHFMEGPHAVEVSKAPHGKLHLRMFSGPSGGHEVAVGEADFTQFVSELFTQAQRLLDECKLRDWWSSDEEALASHLQELDRELRLSAPRQSKR